MRQYFLYVFHAKGTVKKKSIAIFFVLQMRSSERLSHLHEVTQLTLAMWDLSPGPK